MKARLAYGILLFFFFITNLYSQILVEGETLKRILLGLHTYDIHPTGEGLFPLGNVCPGKQVLVESSGSVIQDIRLSLFHDDFKTGALKPVYHFMERYWLDLLLQSRTDQINFLRGDFVIVRVNNENLATSGYSVKDILQKIDIYTPFSLNIETNVYKATWCLPDTLPTVEMIFQKQYDLILGKDKKELSHLLVGELKAYKQEVVKKEISIKDTTSFQLTAMQNLFFDPGGTFLIPQMKSGRYLLQTGKHYEYLFRERFRDESLLNLFSHADDMGWNGNIEVQIKGYKLSEMVNMQMNEWVSFMKSQYCKTYVGMEEDTPEIWTGTAIYVNDLLMYKHLLYFTFPRAAFKQPDTEIKAVLYPYIPLNNLTDLYNERNDN